MLKITLVCIGNLKQPEVASLCAEYQTRLRLYAKLSIVELPPAKQSTSATKERVINDESTRLTEHLATYANALIVLLDEHGKHQTSKEFSIWLYGQSQDIVFAIGGAFGFNDSIRKKYPNQLTLSAMTLQHDLARLLFLEQLYRAATIHTGKTYHY
jgi:23S rRNA (pseudouridine1915-N3)-methyltransferase